MPTIVIVTGHIDSEVTSRQVGDDQKTVANFRVNDGKGWVSIDAWGELAAKVPPKGAFVIVQGRLQTRSYDKDVNGTTVKMYATSVVASSIEVVGAQAPAPQQQAPAAPRTAAQADPDLFSD